MKHLQQTQQWLARLNTMTQQLIASLKAHPKVTLRIALTIVGLTLLATIIATIITVVRMRKHSVPKVDPVVMPETPKGTDQKSQAIHTIQEKIESFLTEGENTPEKAYGILSQLKQDTSMQHNSIQDTNASDQTPSSDNGTAETATSSSEPKSPKNIAQTTFQTPDNHKRNRSSTPQNSSNNAHPLLRHDNPGLRRRGPSPQSTTNQAKSSELWKQTTYYTSRVGERSRKPVHSETLKPRNGKQSFANQAWNAWRNVSSWLSKSKGEKITTRELSTFTGIEHAFS